MTKPSSEAPVSRALTATLITMTQVNIAIRVAQEADWPALLQAMGQVDSLECARQRFWQIIGDPRQYLPLAALDDLVVGYAWAHRGPLHLRAGRCAVRMNDLFVAPQSRRRGVGRILLAAVQQWAADQQATWLEWQASTAALPFYERLGYTGNPCPDPEHPFFEITLAQGAT